MLLITPLSINIKFSGHLKFTGHEDCLFKDEFLSTLHWLNYKCMSITKILYIHHTKQALLTGKFLKI